MTSHGQADDVHLHPNHDWKRRTIARTVRLFGALAALAISTAACGGSPSASVANLGPATSTTGSPSTNSGNDAPRSGGGSSGSASSNSGIGIGGLTEQFSQCMRSHGVPSFPDPNSQGQVQFSGVDPQLASFEAAQRACAKYSPGGRTPPSAAQIEKALAQALKFSQCMRSHGIADFPDPQASSGGGISIRIRAGSGSDLNPNNPQFKAAQQACQSLGFGRASLHASSSSAG